jgi:hypothetical protein
MSLRRPAWHVQAFGGDNVAPRQVPWFSSSWSYAVFFVSLLLLGCGFPTKNAEILTSQHSHINTILVLPFESAGSAVGHEAAMYCPVCNGAFEAGPIESGAEKYLTKQLMAFLKKKTDYELIAPETVNGVRSKVISHDITVPYRRLLIEMGKALHADGVLSGIVWRFRQRVGTALSVESPASVGFGVHLVRVADGRLLWGRHFNETQQTLSEDLFKLSTFVKRGGGWLSAEELAVAGLNEAMAGLPAP